MNTLSSLVRRYGGWIYLSGSLLFYFSVYFIDSLTGILFLILGLASILLEPVLRITARKRGEEGGGTSPLFWLFVLLAVAFFFARQYVTLPPGDAGDVSFVSRLRSVFLVLFLFLYGGTVLYRIFLGMSLSAVDNARSAGDRHREGFLRRSLYSLFAVLPVLVLINYLAAVRNPVLDLSPGYYTFSEGSRSIIASMDRTVELYAFLPGQQAVPGGGKNRTLPELYRITEEVHVMLEQLPLINSRIHLHFLNAELDRDRLADFGTVNNGTIIIRSPRTGYTGERDEKPYTERRVYVLNERDMEKLERETVRALIQVSSPMRTIYMTSLNGERSNILDKKREARGLELFKERIRFYNFQIKTLDLLNGWPGAVPGDADVVFIAGPTTPFSQGARKAVLDYLNRGGRLFVTAAPEGDEDFAWLLEALHSRYRLKKSVLSNVESLPGVVATDRAAEHRMTENLTIAGRSMLLFPLSGYFEQSPADPPPTGGLPEHLEAKEVIQTPPRTILDLNQNGKKDPGEIEGSYPLVVAFQEPSKKEEKSQDPKGKDVLHDRSDDSPRLVVFSGTDWITNQGLTIPIDNRNIILAADALFWLTESPLAASLTPEERSTRQIRISDDVKTRNMVLGMIGFPLLSAGLLLGITLLFRKRRSHGERE